MKNKYIVIPTQDYETNELWETPLCLFTSLKSAKATKKECEKADDYDQKYIIYQLKEV